MTRSERFDREFAEEKRKTAICLADVQKFLSHDTSPTRKQLAETLRARAELIESGGLTETYRKERRGVIYILAILVAVSLLLFNRFPKLDWIFGSVIILGVTYSHITQFRKI